MSSTRYNQQPLQIYQDPLTSFDRAPMPSSRNSSNPRKISPLRPIKNAASRRNIILNPPESGPSKQSPSKVAHQTSSSPSRAPFGNKLNAMSMPPPRMPTHNTDSMEKKQPLMSKFKTGAPQKTLFNTFSTMGEKENYPQSYFATPSHYDGLPQSNFSLEGLYPAKPPLKRLLEAAPIQEGRNYKKVKVEENHVSEEAMELPVDLPAPESFPPLVDDGTKPPHSYAQLIGMSILRAANRRLTLAQIYKWISDTFSFYGATDAGWQNSIRHNLSLNKAFVKQERPKDDPGKGNYWVIEQGMEQQFIKEKHTRRYPGHSESSTILTALPTPIQAPTPVPAPMPTPMPLLDLPPSGVFKPLAATPKELPTSRLAYSPHDLQLPTSKEPSSDATIPASDACNDHDQEASSREDIPSSPLMRSSPPPAAMHSSPPIPQHVSRRNDTPPPVPRFPSSSTNRSRKRKFASMDDSADRPRIKRGRAEEAIARLRGSSYDSPTKNRTFAPLSSSPLRQSVPRNSNQMLPPLTPAVKLRAHLRPPPSISPNTNLKMHRDKVRAMVGSPLRGVTSLDEDLPWSPAFHLEDSTYIFQDFVGGNEFDIFNEHSFLSVPGDGSPEKRSAKRPRIDRSKSANILSGTSHHNFAKNVTSTPSLKLTPSVGVSIFSSPNSGLGLMDSPSKMLNLSSPTKVPSPSFNLEAFDLPNDDFFGNEFLEEDFNDFAGVDIMQGFQRIGAGGRNTPQANSSRPPFSRSFTSRF
ncbi:fork head domain-containing protein [Amylocarpus encephaloides]|uniref:Fork head domain-containing protein n=1 Tax=Amylocarpus encephaloides TaxID=45428 RepID=A0A9P8C2P5_9HELO|nr:fork head domain-containing protein [Amylocarpus encephaloides]